jgi:signal transduction histidine kinase
VVTRRGGSLRIEPHGALPHIPLDRDRLRQVLANLVGNASNAGASDIRISVEVGNTNLVFAVGDNGPGIPAEDLPRIFERYWRGERSGYEGSGLGLPIARGIVKALGGSMWITSTIGVGSTFSFSLPVNV